MVMNYGRSLETVRMRNKPIGSGLKIWALCDNGYTYYAYPHSHRFPWHCCEDYRNVLNHCEAIVVRLIESLRRKVPFSRPESLQMYAVFMDNLFSTPKLFALLKETEMAACETVRSNTKEFPTSIAIRRTSDKKMNWNTLGSEICANGNLLALTWIDNGAVQLISTMYEVGEGHWVEKLRKRPRLTCTSGRRVRTVSETMQQCVY